MSTIKLISDSSCDFTEEEILQYNIDIVPFSVSFDDVTYLQENIDITKEVFYEKLGDPNVFAKTSLPSVNLYLEVFEKAYKEGQEILCFTLSSKLSGSYQSAENAKRIMQEDYPDCKIEVVDTLQVSVSQGALIKFGDTLIKKGKTLEEVASIVRKNTSNIELTLTVSTLKYLQKGGRIGKVSAIAGDVLQLSPIINVVDGELVSRAKVRGNKKAILYCVNSLKDFAQEHNMKIEDCHVYAYTCTTDIDPLIKKLNEEGFNNLTMTNVGVTVTAHTGVTIYGTCIYYFEE